MTSILFSSTRQWNCGDEFIFFGIKHLLQDCGLKFNLLLNNRHPDINPPGDLIPKQPLWRQALKPQPRVNKDNSYFLDGPDNAVDYVIFAGSPEWSGGKRCDPLAEYILKKKLGTAFLGVGSIGKVYLAPIVERVLRERTDLFVARDPICHEEIGEIRESHLLSCPALFSARTERARTGLGKIGCVIQNNHLAYNAVSRNNMFERSVELYKTLQKQYPIELIAHHNADYETARKLFPDVPCRYSAYSEDYPGIFDEFDLVVSIRVHGSGLASSLGVPNIYLAHDGRSATAKGFLSQMVTPEEVVDLIPTLDIAALSQALIAHKAQQKEQWISLLQEHLPILK